MLLAGLGAARPAGAAPCTQLCPPAQNPCTVASLTCDSPVSFDLGGRALSIQGTLAVTAGDGNGVLNIMGAASVSLGSGAKMTAQGASGEGGQISIASAGNITLAQTSSIDVSADAGDGTIQIDATSGTVHVSGLLDAHAGKNGSGGDVIVNTDQAGDIIIDTVGRRESTSPPAATRATAARSISKRQATSPSRRRWI